MIAVRRVEVPRTESDSCGGVKVGERDSERLGERLGSSKRRPVSWIQGYSTSQHVGSYLRRASTYRQQKFPNFLGYVPGGSIARILGKRCQFNEDVTEPFIV